MVAFILYLALFLGILTFILILLGVFSNEYIFARLIITIWLAGIGLVGFAFTTSFFTSKKRLEKEDYYGSYIIDKSCYPGKLASWQYDNFRFEIKKNDSIYFYLTRKDKIVKTYKGAVTTVRPFDSEILAVRMDQPTFHITATNPSVYRSVWSFRLVFSSEKFKNVFFKKGDWEAPLN